MVAWNKFFGWINQKFGQSYNKKIICLFQQILFGSTKYFFDWIFHNWFEIYNETFLRIAPRKKLLDLAKKFCERNQYFWLNLTKYLLDLTKSYQNELSFVAWYKFFGWINQKFGQSYNKKIIWLIQQIVVGSSNFLFNQQNSTNHRIFLSQWSNFVGSTKYFIVLITTKYYGWTNKNFVDLTKHFFDWNFHNWFKKYNEVFLRIASRKKLLDLTE